MKTTSTLLLALAILLSACTAPATAPVPTAVESTLEPAAVDSTAEPAAAIPSADIPVFDLSADLEPVAVAGTYLFTEGPAADMNGNVYFSDINAGKIYKWSTDGSVTVFVEGLNMPNGLMFDRNGNLVVCEGGNGRLISIDPQGRVTVLVDSFDGLRFNEPNDLWIDAQGGIYFSDPAYQSAVVQDGEHVYYLWPDRTRITRVINDMVRPNGLVGSADGSTLYVADHGAGQTFAYAINSDGTLSDKRLFVASGSDGMTLDTAGNLYLTTTNQVQVYDPAGNQVAVISTQENPTNVTFAGTDGLTLFITARTAVYTVRSSAQAAAPTTTGSTLVSTPNDPGNAASTSGFTLTSPDIGLDGLLPVEYTCDGSASTLALSWSGAPAGTVSYAVIMHHVAPDNEIKWYWVLYDIPAGVTGLPKNTTGIGILGTNSVNDQPGYEPPCSQGPGDKTYVYTVYALSAQPQLSVPASQVNRAALLDAIQDITLGSAELSVVYARP